MTTDSTSTDGAAQPLGVGSSEGLGPLPETTLAEVRNDFMHKSRLSETGVAYWGSNWYEARKLYTAEQMRAYGAQERAAERERWRTALGACDAALALCQPCAEPDCRAVQREYIDEARAAAAALLRA